MNQQFIIIGACAEGDATRTRILVFESFSRHFNETCSESTDACHRGADRDDSSCSKMPSGYAQLTLLHRHVGEDPHRYGETVPVAVLHLSQSSEWLRQAVYVRDFAACFPHVMYYFFHIFTKGADLVLRFNFLMLHVHLYT